MHATVERADALGGLALADAHEERQLGIGDGTGGTGERIHNRLLVGDSFRNSFRPGKHCRPRKPETLSSKTAIGSRQALPHGVAEPDGIADDGADLAEQRLQERVEQQQDGFDRPRVGRDVGQPGNRRRGGLDVAVGVAAR